MKRTKKYLEAKDKIVEKKQYNLEEAVDLIKENSKTKFVASVDVVVKLGLDSSKPEQQLRGALVLPHQFGKSTVVVAITDDVKDAKAAGADFAGGGEIIEKIKSGWLDFDVIVTSPKFMPELGKLGKILGPKGLMPTLKTGNVGPNIAALVKDFKNGKRKYASDTFGNVHMCIGKTDTATNQIVENLRALVALLKSVRPSTVKGDYFQKISLSTTMGPSIDVSALVA